MLDVFLKTNLKGKTSSGAEVSLKRVEISSIEWDLENKEEVVEQLITVPTLKEFVTVKSLSNMTLNYDEHTKQFIISPNSVEFIKLITGCKNVSDVRLVFVYTISNGVLETFITATADPSLFKAGYNILQESSLGETVYKINVEDLKPNNYTINPLKAGTVPSGVIFYELEIVND